MSVCPRQLSDRIGIIFFALMLVLAFSGCGQEEKIEQKELVRPVKFFKVGGVGKGMNIEYSGAIKAFQG